MRTYIFGRFEQVCHHSWHSECFLNTSMYQWKKIILSGLTVTPIPYPLLSNGKKLRLSTPGNDALLQYRNKQHSFCPFYKESKYRFKSKCETCLYELTEIEGGCTKLRGCSRIAVLFPFSFPLNMLPKA